MKNKNREILIHYKLHRRAKELRQTQTSAEEILWKILRRKQLGGYKFRRQHPIGPFIADFSNPALKLVIEIDGGIHSQQKDYDAARSTWLEDRGYKIIRFTNEEIKENLEEVLNTVLATCQNLGND